MKKVIKLLPVMAILLGSGLAVASNSLYNTPNVVNVTPGDGPPVWEAIGSQTVNCDDNHYRICKAFKDGDTISDEVYGDRL